MGLNIFVYRHISGSHKGRDLKLENYSSKIGFDESKHTGDREFLLSMEKVITLDEQIDDYDMDYGQYHRPADIEEIRSWVNSQDNLAEGNKTRLLKLLDALESDKDLWLYCSY